VRHYGTIRLRNHSVAEPFSSVLAICQGMREAARRDRACSVKHGGSRSRVDLAMAIWSRRPVPAPDATRAEVEARCSNRPASDRTQFIPADA